MESKIRRIYQEAQSELTEKFTNYITAQQAYINDLQNEYDEMKRIGQDAEAKKLGKTLGAEKKKLTLQNDRYKAMIKETTRRIANVNQIAVDYLNGEMPQIYTVNYNQLAKNLGDLGVRYDMVDEWTVARRIKDGDIKLPKKKINIPKDQRWNAKRLNSAVLQGILQGESMDKIADRILPIIDSNKKAAIRNARTMVTGSENVGRNDSYLWADKQGIVMKKVWLATEDHRTRNSHLKINGEEVDPKDSFSNGLRYPADPSGAPREVYNCRCTMITNIAGFRRADGSIIEIGEQQTPDATYVQPNVFKKTFDKAKSLLKKGEEWRVDDTYTVEDYVHKKLYKLKGGSVVAVTDEGDIVSVCKNIKGDDRGSDLLKVAVKNGGDRLDAFGDGLYQFYTKNGFEPVSWTHFDEEYAPHDWVKGRDNPEPVIFYKYTGKITKQSYKDFIKNTTASADYDEAMDIRNKSIDKRKH